MDNYHLTVVHASYLGVLQAAILRTMQDGSESGDLRGHSEGSLVDLGGGHALMNLELYDRANGSPLPKYIPLNGDSLPAAVDATTPRGRTHLGELQSRFGVERTKNMLREGGTHALVFPNLVLIGVHMRVFQPISFDRTEVCLYPTTLKWLAPEVNAIRLRSHEAFFGPASFGGPDDAEIFERVMEGLRAAPEPWVLFARGMGTESRRDGIKSGPVTGETSQRGIWSQWKKVMTAREPAARARRPRHLHAATVGRLPAAEGVQAKERGSNE